MKTLVYLLAMLISSALSDSAEKDHEKDTRCAAPDHREKLVPAKKNHLNNFIYQESVSNCEIS